MSRYVNNVWLMNGNLHFKLFEAKGWQKNKLHPPPHRVDGSSLQFGYVML